jgi:hypothetical protein
LSDLIGDFHILRSTMKLKTIFNLLFIPAFLLGCASTKKSISLGLATGGVTGAILGSTMSKDHDKGAMTGLAIGAIIGAIASYFIDDELQKRDQDTRRDTLFNLEKHGVFGSSTTQGYAPQSNYPYGLSSPVVDEQFIDTHVKDGTKLIEGHRTWVIQEGSKWSPASPKGK